MLIMAEVTAEMGVELRAAALANHTSVAAEVGRRLERLDRLEATVEAGSNVDGLGSVHPVRYREVPEGIDDTATEALMRHLRNKEYRNWHDPARSEADVLCDLLRQAEAK